MPTVDNFHYTPRIRTRNYDRRTVDNDEVNILFFSCIAFCVTLISFLLLFLYRRECSYQDKVVLLTVY